MNLFQKSKSIFIQSQNGDRANYWLQVNDNFDENDPSAGCVFPENQVVGTTVAVKYNNAIAFFTWTGQVWSYDYVFEGGSEYTPEYVVKKWCGILSDNQAGVYTTTPLNSNSPDYFGDFTLDMTFPGNYILETTEDVTQISEVVYTGSSFKVDPSPASLFIDPFIPGVNIGVVPLSGFFFNNDHICLEFYIPL